jgi:hypothetical protein
VLFTRASEFLTDHVGRPTATVGPPQRQCLWLLPREGNQFEHIRVRLEDAGTHAFARLRIVDDYARGTDHEEVVTILQEPDFEVALERVRAHRRG